MRRTGGFTLVEVMIAVVILALAATAALKLAILSQNTLAEVREGEDLLNAAQAIEVGVTTGELEAKGESGDYKWETEDKEVEYFGEDFGKLNFDEASGDNEDAIKVKWRNLTVADKEERRKITLITAPGGGEGQINARSSDASQNGESD